MKVIKDTYIHINIGTKDRIDWSALFHCKVVKEDSENNSGFKVLQKREILASNYKFFSVWEQWQTGQVVNLPDGKWAS